jgi:hypothetical protein
MGLLNLKISQYKPNFGSGPNAVSRLYVYTVGTESLCPIYEDSNLTLIRSNPIIVKGNEKFPISYLLDGEYRIIIKDKHDKVLDEIENLIVGSSGPLGHAHGYSNVGDLKVDSFLSYQKETGGLQVFESDIISVTEGGYRYCVAASDADDFHIATQGGVKLYVETINGGISIGAFGGDYDSDLAAAISAAAKTGAIVQHEPGQLYISMSGVKIADTAVHIDFCGARVSRAGENNPILEVCHTYNDVCDVNAISVVDIDFGGGNSPCQRISVDPNESILANLVVGDVVKIVSDQYIPSSAPEDNERLGELIEVASVNTGAGHIDCVGLLREAFALSGNNVRLARATYKKCVIKGLDGSSLLGYEPLLRVIGGIRPIISLRAESAFSPAVELLSCYRANVKAIVKGLMSNASQNQYGYGIASYGCKNGHYDVTAERVRHAWTSGARGVVDLNSGDIQRYGGSIDEYVFVDAADCYGAAFDTHSDALGTVARGIIRNSFPGDSTSNTCFQVRGRDCDIDLTTVGIRSGKVIIGNGGGGHRIKVNHHRPHDDGLTLPIFEVEGDSLNDQSEVWLDLTNKSNFGQFPIIHSSNCHLIVQSLHSKDTRTGTSTLRPCIINAEFSRVEIHNWRVDWDSGDGNLTPALARLDSTSDVSFYGGHLRRGSGAYFLADLRNGSGRVRFERLACDLLPDEPVNAGSADWAVCQLTVNGSNLENTVVLNGNSNDSASALEGYLQTLDSVLTQSRTISLPSSGLYQGMRIEFIRTKAALGDHNWTITGAAESVSLWPNSRATFVYEGSEWMLLEHQGWRGLQVRGNVSPTLTDNSGKVQVFTAPLSNHRTLRLATEPSIYHVVRTATATGAFNLTIANSTGTTIHTLGSADSWAQIAVGGDGEYVVAAK